MDYAAAMVLGAMREAGLSGSDALEWLGKTFDLSKAYKQLAVLPDHQLHAVVGFPCGGKWQFYKSVSLPFVCTGSVYGFVRISQALWFLISKLLKAITSHYFDLPDSRAVRRLQGPDISLQRIARLAWMGSCKRRRQSPQLLGDV